MKKTKLCPVCKKSINLESSQEFLPFCSRYCKNRDLLSWMNEGYKIPVISDGDDELEDDSRVEDQED